MSARIRASNALNGPREVFAGTGFSPQNLGTFFPTVRQSSRCLRALANAAFYSVF
jgi:hypothetical protein